MNGHHYGAAYDLETLANRYQTRTAQEYGLVGRAGSNGSDHSSGGAPGAPDYDPSQMTGSYGASVASRVGMGQPQHQRHQYGHHNQYLHQLGHSAHHHLHYRQLMPSAAGGNGGENGSGGGRGSATTLPGGGGVPDMEPLPISSKMAAVARRLGQSPVPNMSNLSSGNNSPVSAGMSARLDYGRANLQSELMQNAGMNAFPELFQTLSAAQYQQQSQQQLQQQHQQYHQLLNGQTKRNGGKKRDPPQDEWLDTISMDIPGLSLEPISGTEVLRRLKEKTNDVIVLYLPCVDFLVTCQQELRKGLAAATQKTLVHHMFRDSMTPQQFYQTYIAPLPDRFFRKNRSVMPREALDKAVKELNKLCANARGVELQGCETVKNTFLGGMKDGESWGLRKWLSKNGAALNICNDCECILGAARKLDRKIDSTRKLSALMRPMAEQSLKRLKTDVPSSYQEVSTAHPYLPFFHRLESALKAMAAFDPDDDDVICIDSDDDDVEEVKPPPKPKPKAIAKPKTKPRKRKTSQTTLTDHFPVPSKKAFKPPPAAVAPPPAAIRPTTGSHHAAAAAAATAAGIPVANAHDDSSSSGSEDGNVIEILEVKAGSKRDTESPSADSYLKALNFFPSLDEELAGTTDSFDPPGLKVGSGTNGTHQKQSLLAASEQQYYSAASSSLADMLKQLESIIVLVENDNVGSMRPGNIDVGLFWNEPQHYLTALRIFGDILRQPDSCHYVDPVDDEALMADGYDLPYSQFIKNPLCFSDIMQGLQSHRGRLDGRHGLKNWNMWRGSDLLQAIDLVFVNDLAYGRAAGERRSQNRSRTNKLRKKLWNGIKTTLDIYVGTSNVERRRKLTPTRRGESSGFVIHKR